MKLNGVTQFLALLVILPSSAEKIPSFQQADSDKDTMLSVEEASTAFPDLFFFDGNRDGVINKSEAEFSLPGLSLPRDSVSNEPVNDNDYHLIVNALKNYRDKLTPRVETVISPS